MKFATYTDLPNLPRQGSSEVCRVPLKLPILDINKVMKVVPELQFDHACTTRIHSRMLATLKFRLAMKIRALGITSILHRRHDREESARFLAAFRSAATLMDEEEALVACLRLCEYFQPSKSVRNPIAAALLVGSDKYRILLLSARKYFRQV